MVIGIVNLSNIIQKAFKRLSIAVLIDERREQSEWERLRMSCLCMLQPYSKKRLRAEDVMRFPWETESRGSAVSHRGQSNNITLSAEEMEARREAAIARYGLK